MTKSPKTPTTVRLLAVNPVDAQESVKVSIFLLGAYGVLGGSVGLWDDLKTTQSYAAVANVPAGLVPYSIAILVNSLAILAFALTGNKRLLSTTLMLGGIWTLALAIGFVIAYVDYPGSVSLLAFCSLALIATTHCQKAWMMWSSRNINLVYVRDVQYVEAETPTSDHEE